jgi:hypothetical protein
MKARTRIMLVCCVAVLLGRPGLSSAAAEGMPCAAEPMDMLIAYGDVVTSDTCWIDPVGDADVFRFAGTPGETVVIQVVPRSLGPACVELKGPAGATIRQACSPARVTAALMELGTHTIVVTEFLNDGTMPYTLVLERVAPPSPAASDVCPSCTATDMIDPAGDLDVFRFQGEGGDAVLIQVTPQSGGPACLEVFAPNGSVVRSACSPARLDLTLAQTGTHSILVSEFQNNGTMSYAVFFECIGSCGLPATLACEIRMSQTIYVVGEVVTASRLRLANHTPAAVATELKLWLGLQGFAPIRVTNVVINLPAGFDQDFGPVPLFPVTSGFPSGMHEFSCRMLDPVTGEAQAVDLNPFQIP